MNTETLIAAKNVKVHYPIQRSLIGKPRGMLRAVDGVSIEISKGEVLGLVGESGSGKSTLGRTMIALEKPTSGAVLMEGTDLSSLEASQLKPYRQRMQMVFQDPFGSLNPRMTVEQILSMPLRFSTSGTSRAERRKRVEEALQRVGLSASFGARYPHEFSGGQRQRIGIARALMVSPDFIVADEPVSALDVSVQAQVLNLFSRIQQDLNLTMMFVTHDLAVVGYIADKVAVMYLGRIVEIASTSELFRNPRHPYTEALFSAAPDPHVKPASDRQRVRISGEIPSPINPPTGCSFRTRCPYALAECASIRPELRTASKTHRFACIRDDLTLTTPITTKETAS